MVNEVAQEVQVYVKPIFEWLSVKGADFAVNLVAALTIFIIGAIAIKILSKSLGSVLEKKIEHREMLIKFFVSVAIKIAWIILIVTVLGKIGVDVGPIIAGLGVTGFILGFAFQESLGSLAAGLMIAIIEPFKPGDYVSVAGHEGTICHLDMMAVTLTTPDNRKITIPNKQAWGSPIVNYSAMELRRVDTAIGIAYGSDIVKARSVATATLASIKGVLANPAPMAEVVRLDDSEVVLTCRAWVKNADYWSVFFAANHQVMEAFDREGIDIPFPQLDVRMVK